MDEAEQAEMAALVIRELILRQLTADGDDQDEEYGDELFTMLRRDQCLSMIVIGQLTGICSAMFDVADAALATVNRRPHSGATTLRCATQVIDEVVSTFRVDRADDEPPRRPHLHADPEGWSSTRQAGDILVRLASTASFGDGSYFPEAAGMHALGMSIDELGDERVLTDLLLLVGEMMFSFTGAYTMIDHDAIERASLRSRPTSDIHLELIRRLVDAFVEKAGGGGPARDVDG